MEFSTTYQSSTVVGTKTTYHLKGNAISIKKEQYIPLGGQKGNVIQSIPFVDANRDDDTRSCSGTVDHVSGVHPNRSHP